MEGERERRYPQLSAERVRKDAERGKMREMLHLGGKNAPPFHSINV